MIMPNISIPPMAAINWFPGVFPPKTVANPLRTTGAIRPPTLPTMEKIPLAFATASLSTETLISYPVMALKQLGAIPQSALAIKIPAIPGTNMTTKYPVPAANTAKGSVAFFSFVTILLKRSSVAVATSALTAVARPEALVLFVRFWVIYILMLTPYALINSVNTKEMAHSS